MTISPTAVWRVRPVGNDLNGSGYDPVYTGGTDYSQSDTPILSLTGLTTSAANSTALLNAANTFTAAMVGNAIRIASGTNFTAGYYFITAFTSAGNVTLDRTPTSAGAGSAGVGRVGGAAKVIQTITGSGSPVMPGNVVYARALMGTDGWDDALLSAAIASTTATTLAVASFTPWPTTGSYYAMIDQEVVIVTAGLGTTTWTITRAQLGSTAATHVSGSRVTLIDYPSEGLYSPASGDTTSGRVRIQGENGRPHVSVSSRWLDTLTSNEANGFLLTVRGAGGYAAIYMSNRSICRAISVDVRGFTPNAAMIEGGNQNQIIDCEVWGGVSTTLTNTGYPAFKGSSLTLIGCRVHQWPGNGVLATGGKMIIGCVITQCAGLGIEMSPATYSDHASVIANNTIDASGSHGLQFTGDVSMVNEPITIFNNLITGHVGAGAYAINLTGGTKATNDKLRGFIDFNFFSGNTNNFNSAQMSAAANDSLSAAPSYGLSTAVRYPDYSLGPALRGLAFSPRQYGSVQRSYMDPGGLQRKESVPAPSVLII